EKNQQRQKFAAAGFKFSLKRNTNLSQVWIKSVSSTAGTPDLTFLLCPMLSTDFTESTGYSSSFSS
ncbi:hypothetical protein, partial [Paenibacillus chitinolyticus]|uniref:hypothetical protein n=1 Tax=Paenibacillus chitinolyticus TaxID=79263 RepID=UPI00367202EF